MTYPNNPNTEMHRAELSMLIDNAIGVDVDVIADTGSGFVSVMTRKNPNVRKDVAAAVEMYTLLSHYLPSLPIHAVSVENTDALLTPSIFYDEQAGRVLALISVGAEEFEYVAHWLSEGLRSNIVKAMPGILALPFSIEKHEEQSHLIPEWFAAFYVNGNEDHCVPILALRSVTLDERFGDWVAIALERMKIFGMPCASASAAIDQRKAP